MKKLVIVILAVSLVFSLCGCSLLYEYTNSAIDSFDVGYSKMLNKAFFANYNWDGTADGMNIILPEEYNKTKITGLGGYTGRGYPAGFVIDFTDVAKEELCSNATQWSYTNHTANIEAADIQFLSFQLHISKNIKEIENLSMGGIVLAKYEENGETIYNVYILTCYVTCDENNKTFYAKDGKLYFKQTDKLVDDIIYEDFNIEDHNKGYKDQPRCQSVF